MIQGSMQAAKATTAGPIMAAKKAHTGVAPICPRSSRPMRQMKKTERAKRTLPEYTAATACQNTRLLMTDFYHSWAASHKKGSLHAY